MALCKDEEMVEEARDLEVDLAVGPEFRGLVEVSLPLLQLNFGTLSLP